MLERIKVANRVLRLSAGRWQIRECILVKVKSLAQPDAAATSCGHFFKEVCGFTAVRLNVILHDVTIRDCY